MSIDLKALNNLKDHLDELSQLQDKTSYFKRLIEELKGRIPAELYETVMDMIEYNDSDRTELASERVSDLIEEYEDEEE